MWIAIQSRNGWATKKWRLTLFCLGHARPRKRLKRLSPKKKKNFFFLRLFQGPKARLMHQRKIEASGPGELSEENAYLFTQDGLGGAINSRSLLTKSLSECRKAVCALVGVDHGGVCMYSPETVSTPCVHNLNSNQNKQPFFTQ